jgi:prohibitin 2
MDTARIIRLSVIGVLAIVLFFGTFVSVGAGERGVKTRFGAVVKVLSPGLHVKVPFVEGVHKMNIQTISFRAPDDAPLMAASNDLQDTRISAVVNYHINPSIVANLYQQYGDSTEYYGTTVINPQITATIKSIASQYTAAEQVQKRQEMSDHVLAALQGAFADKNVVIEKADVTNIRFSPAYEGAIEAKVTAVQNAEAAKNKLEQSKYEADQRIAQAKGEAEAIRIQSQAIESQGGKNYVALQAIAKWDGKYPTTMFGGNSIPLISVQGNAQ